MRALNLADRPPLTCAWATTRLLLPSPWYRHSISSIFPSSIPRCGRGALRGRELEAAGLPGHQPPPTGQQRLSPATSTRSSAGTRRRGPPEATPPKLPRPSQATSRFRPASHLSPTEADGLAAILGTGTVTHFRSAIIRRFPAWAPVVRQAGGAGCSRASRRGQLVNGGPGGLWVELYWRASSQGGPSRGRSRGGGGPGGPGMGGL